MSAQYHNGTYYGGGGGDVTGRAKSEAIAPVFDDTETYAEGDRVMYEDELYVFNTAHTGAWDAADADKTDVDSEIPDKLTSQQMQAIKDAFVIDTPRTGYPIMFDETGAEHVVAWYRYANGTKKPVYEASRVFSRVESSGNSWAVTDASSILNIETSIFAGVLTVEGTYYPATVVEDNGVMKFMHYRELKLAFNRFILRYTKTTDTPQ